MDTKLYILTGNIVPALYQFIIEVGLSKKLDDCYLKGSKKEYSGDGARDTPVPIPNTEVKPSNADGTRRETSR